MMLLGSFSAVLLLNLRRVKKQWRDRRTINATAKAEHTKGDVDEFPVYAIGKVKSCFRECRGTPRQGLFAPSTRGKIVLKKKIPSSSLDGLEHFSHVWVLFIFHMNTNFHLTKRAHTDKSHNFRPKIKPPMLKGKSIGLFATRTPHRPNAVGITLVKIDSISLKDRSVYISSLDLADGTPVVDIKPYVTPYDSVPEALTPQWCGQGVSMKRANVIISIQHRKTINEAAARGKLRHYNDGEEVCQALVELLSTDIRPSTSYTLTKKKGKKANVDPTCRFRFDMLRIGFVVLTKGQPGDAKNIEVTEVIVETEKDDRDIRKGKKARYPTT